MIAEALLHLSARSNSALRRLGLVGESVALWSRATRRRRIWTAHHDRCRIFVGSAVATLPRRDTVLVLGSGLMRDIPLRLLTERFRRVILADAVHLLPIRWRARGRAVELAVVDLTGVAESLARGVPGRGDALARYRDDAAIDLVVSANCLSQMPMAPARWLRRRPAEAPRFPTAFGGAIQAGHLHDLAAFRCPVCLISDVGFRDIAQDGTQSDETALVEGLDLPEPDAVWEWEVAPAGEISRLFARVHRVQAWRDIRASHPSA